MAGRMKEWRRLAQHRLRRMKGCVGWLRPVAAFILLTLPLALWLCMANVSDVIPMEIRARVRGPIPADHPQVLALLRSSYLHPPSLLPYNLSTDPDYIKDLHRGTWYFIHEHVVKLFSEQRGGFFVEAGALDGERNSNTLWLEENLGWTGLLVEPNSFSFENLLNKQRKAWASNTCLSPHTYPTQTVLVSTITRAAENSPNPTFTHRGSSYLLGYELYSDMYNRTMKRSDKSYVVSQCFPLASYLMALNVTTVDFLSLDIQGVEKYVLGNLPWTSLTVRVIVMEVMGEFVREFRSFMTERNYTLVAEGKMDYLFVKNNDPILDRFYSRINTN